jgi:hypothetical protein
MLSKALSLAIDRLNIVHEQDDLDAVAAVTRRKKVRAFSFPVRCILCRQLNGGFSTRHFSVVVAVAGDDAKAQRLLKPVQGLFKVAYTQFNPTCFRHDFATFHVSSLIGGQANYAVSNCVSNILYVCI